MRIQKRFLVFDCRNRKVISKDVLKECVEANEASVKDYLSQFFRIEELDFSWLRQSVLAEAVGMPV